VACSGPFTGARGLSGGPAGCWTGRASHSKQRRGAATVRGGLPADPDGETTIGRERLAVAQDGGSLRNHHVEGPLPWTTPGLPLSQHELLAELDIVERAHRQQFHLRPPHRRARTDPSTRQSRIFGVGRARTHDRRRATPAPPGNAASGLINPPPVLEGHTSVASARCSRATLWEGGDSSGSLVRHRRLGKRPL
jgi:hypothetical protein